MREVSLDILCQLTNEFTSMDIGYLIIGGWALDGKRGCVTRKHEDVDILVPKFRKDSSYQVDLTLEVMNALGYKGKRYYDLFRFFRTDGSKVEAGFVSIDGDEAVMHAQKAVTTFPSSLLYSPQQCKINAVQFAVAPNEILYVYAPYSEYEADRTLALSLPVNKKILTEITRTLREPPT